jgi:hypothetical protein
MSRHLWKSSGRSTRHLDAVHRFFCFIPVHTLGIHFQQGGRIDRRPALSHFPRTHVATSVLNDLQLTSDFQ